MLDIGLAAKTAAANVDKTLVTEQVRLFVDTDGALKWKTNSGTVVPVAGGVPKFGSFYQTVADVTGTIAANLGPVLFAHASSNNTGDMALDPVTGIITVVTAGNYGINWGVSGAEANAFGLYLNGALVVGTIEGNGDTLSQNKGSTILSLAAGDTLKLVTVNCASVITLQLAGTTNTDQNVANLDFWRC